MNSKYSLFALAVIVASGLAACDKNHPKSLQAQAEVAKASGKVETKEEVFTKTSDANFKEEESLRDKGIAFSGLDIVTTWTTGLTTKESRPAVRESLLKMIENANTNVGLAQSMNDEAKLKLSSENLAKYKKALAMVDAEEASEKSREARHAKALKAMEDSDAFNVQ